MNARLLLGWDLEISYGEGWLIVRPCPRGEYATDLVPLADEVLELLERYLVNRVVLVLDGIGMLNSFLIGQLVKVHRTVESRGGLLRLCKVSPNNRRALETTGLGRRLPIYEDIEEAVMPGFPRKPR